MARTTRSGGGPVDVRVDADQLRLVKRELNRLGDKDLKKALFAGLNKATKPMREAALSRGTQRLPRRGGLAQRVQTRTKLGTSTSRGGVAVFARNRSQARLLDRGFVRHPVYGNTSVWVTSPVRPGWFSDPMVDGAPIARREVIDLLDDLAKQAARRTNS